MSWLSVVGEEGVGCDCTRWRGGDMHRCCKCASVCCVDGTDYVTGALTLRE